MKELLTFINEEEGSKIIDAMKNALKEELNAWYGYIIVKEWLTGTERKDIEKFYEDTAKDELEDFYKEDRLSSLQKAKELENIIEEDKKTTDKEETVEIEEETNMQKLQRIKEKLMKEKEESDSYLNELDTKLRYKSSKSNLKSSQSTFASTQNFPRSSSVKNINS